jgi:hypothetical protein
MTQARKLLKIGAFAELAGTNLRTLCYYEEVGLLQPAARSSGGFRYYREPTSTASSSYKTPGTRPHPRGDSQPLAPAP